MKVKIENGMIAIPQALMEELQLENGQDLNLSGDGGCLKAVPDPAKKTYTPDQQLAMYIAEGFTDLEEMVAILVAVLKLKNSIPPGDTETLEAVSARLEEVILELQKKEETDETC